MKPISNQKKMVEKFKTQLMDEVLDDIISDNKVKYKRFNYRVNIIVVLVWFIWMYLYNCS